MKNIHIERLCKAAKKSHRHDRQPLNRDGIGIRHLYDGLDPARLTWWDDVSFILNDYCVNVAWIHPRMKYQDMIEDEARRLVKDVPHTNLLEHQTQNYKKVGRSRKSILSWTTNDNQFSDWCVAVSRAEDRLKLEADFCIKPYIQSKWTSHSRFVNICVPIEVRDEDDVRTLANFTKRLLKRETTLEREFFGYAYTQANWLNENLAQDSTDVLHVHRVA